MPASIFIINNNLIIMKTLKYVATVIIGAVVVYCGVIFADWFMPL